MICRANTRKGFSLIEIIIATMIFTVVILGAFSLYRYLIQISTDSRNVGDVTNLQRSAFHAIDGVIQIEGWENFNDSYVDNGTWYLSWNGTDAYTMTSGTEGDVYPPLIDEIPDKYKWEFSFTTDDSLGPYIEQIQKTGTGTILTFSKDISTSGLIDDILPSLTIPSHSWGTSSYQVSTNTIQITEGADITLTVNDAIKPSSNIMDLEGKSDVTYESGVFLPVNSGEIVKGYPQLIKATVTVIVDGIRYKVSRYFRYST